MDLSFNIVEFIETNPISKLTNNYNNKLLQKIKETFTESQQQLFVSSFYCYLNYNRITDFVIDLDNVWKWLGFSQKAMAKRALEKHFIVEKDYKYLLCRSAEQDKEQHGGHNKQIIMLNINTFKLFCIKAETKTANEIHEYFVKLEDLLQATIQEESDELKLQLENAKNEIDKTKQESEITLNNQKVLQREQILLKDFATIGSIIYIIKVKTCENGQYIIKIGESSKGIELRYNEHRTKYPECLLLNCYRVNKSREFEKFIHRELNRYKITTLEGHEKENELFLIGKEYSYNTLTQLIENSIKQFNDFTPFDFKIMLENYIESQNNTYNPNESSLLSQILQGQKEILRKLQTLEVSNDEMRRQIITIQSKTVTNFNEPLITLGPRLQKINPETMTLIQTYESVNECLKEYRNKIKRSTLGKAIKENTIYFGFRWALVNRDEDPTIVNELEPTKQTRVQNIDYIAKLNIDKTEIINLYIDRKTAAKMNEYKSDYALDTPVKNNTISNGYYYVLYRNCKDDVKYAFENKIGGEPILYKDGVGQYNENGTLLREFWCKDHCNKELKMSDKTLNKSINNNASYNGYYYKKLGSKLSY